MLTASDLFPWQNTQWQHLNMRNEQQGMPHALLLVGKKGLGKLTFAKALAYKMLCLDSKDQSACGQCRSCILLQTESHPDFLQLSLIDDATTIKVEQIRQLIDWLNKTTQISHYRLIIVSPAEAMNTATANALLKSLEEPPKNSLFILVSDTPDRLPATIRSRCQIVSFQTTEQDALSWLESQLADQSQAKFLLRLSDNSPLQALALSENGKLVSRQQLLNDLQAIAQNKSSPSTVVNQWLEIELGELLTWLCLIMIDLLRLGTHVPEHLLTQQDILPQLKILLSLYKAPTLFRYYDKLCGLHKKILETNLNKQLVIEDIFIEWHKLRTVTKRDPHVTHR